MSTRNQIVCLALVALSFTSIGHAAPDARAAPDHPAHATTSCITRYTPAFHLRPTRQRPIILTPPCLPWSDPRTPEPVMRFL